MRSSNSSDTSELETSLREIYSGNVNGFFNSANDLQSVTKEAAVELLYKIAIDMGVTDAYLNYGTFISDDPARQGEAISLFTRAYEEGDPQAALGLAQVHLDREDAVSALHWLDLAGEDSRVFMLVAEAHRQRNDEAAAVQELLRGMSKSAEAAVELIRSTNVLSLEDSIGILERHLSDGQLDVLLPLADLYLQVNRNEDAIGLLERAVDACEPNAMHDLGKTLVDLGRRDEGVAYLRRAAGEGDALSRKVLDALEGNQPE